MGRGWWDGGAPQLYHVKFEASKDIIVEVLTRQVAGGI